MKSSINKFLAVSQKDVVGSRDTPRKEQDELDNYRSHFHRDIIPDLEGCRNYSEGSFLC